MVTVQTSLLVFLIIQAMVIGYSSADEATATGFKPVAKPKDYKYEEEKDYWLKAAGDDLKQSIKAKNNTNGRAKNVILFIGDGMGMNTVTAARILEGQKRGLHGEEHRLSFESFPYTGLAVTYSLDSQVTDSAASATAFLSGVKTKQKLVGLSPKAHSGMCETTKGNEVTSILKWFKDAGRSAGIVTTTTVTHATPAAAYSHTPHRNWEGDFDLPEEVLSKCKDIARQLIEDNDDIDVILGGGMSNFKPNLNYTHAHPDNTTAKKRGRIDNKDLTLMWQKKREEKQQAYKFVTDAMELKSVDPNKIDYLFGLFSEFHMDYEAERDKRVQPSLAEMTENAIHVLRKNKDGYFLLVEGGRIDHGHHASKASLALHDVIAFSDAVNTAVKMTNESETLILVTADHSHTMSIAGDSKRGNDILGKSTSLYKSKDKRPYTTLTYANGRGYQSPRQDLTLVDVTENNDYVYQSAVHMESETHGGEDVAMYARGPQSHLYSGVHENNYIPILMAYASCVGQYSNHNDCANAYAPKQKQKATAGVPRSSEVSLMTMIGFTLLAVTVRRFGC